MNRAATRLVLLSRDPARPVPCLLLDAHGQVLSRQCLDPEHPAAPDPAVRTVVAVPGEAVRSLWLELPACTPVQALAAARILLQEHLAGGADGLHIALAPPGDGPRLLGTTDNARMQEWGQRCQALGVVPDTMVPDHLLVDPVADGVQVLVHDGAWLVRGPQLAFAAEPGLARAILGERGFGQVDDPAAVEALLAAAAAAPDPARLDLLQHAHARPRDPAMPGRRRRLAVLAGLCLLSPLLLEGIPALRHAYGAYRMEQRAEALAAAVMTDATSGNATAALRAHHRERAAPVALALQAAALSAALEPLPQARLDSLEYNRDAGLRAGLVHAGEADLEALRSRLAAAGFTLSAQPGEPVDGGLRTPVMLEPAP